MNSVIKVFLQSLKLFVKKWTLLIAICMGVMMYFVYVHVPLPTYIRANTSRVVAVVQPLLIFFMLFLSFCKISVSRLRPRMSHFWLLLIQCGSFVLMCAVLHYCPQTKGNLLIVSAMLCMICPTATSASVVTQKLQGDDADVVMYTLLINFAVAILFPLCVPLIYPHKECAFLTSFLLIMGKVFPMLICPLIFAQLVKCFAPRLHRFFLSLHNLSFYLWAVALSLAIATTTRSITHTDHSLAELLGIALISLLCCIFQFAVGRLVGIRYNLPVSTSQGLGQKNTVLAIWMGYTFFNPVSSIAGGFYSIWHNLYNTYQLRQKSKNV